MSESAATQALVALPQITYNPCPLPASPGGPLRTSAKAHATPGVVIGDFRVEEARTPLGSEQPLVPQGSHTTDAQSLNGSEYGLSIPNTP